MSLIKIIYIYQSLIITIIGFLVGGFTSFFISKHFYDKSSKDLDKLSPLIRDILTESPKKLLTISELNKLVEEKVYDTNSTSPLPLKCCPECGSKDLDFYQLNNEKLSLYCVECKSCGYQDSTE